MNWKRFYATVHTICLVWSSAIGAGIIVAMLATGLCRFAFDLDEKPAMAFIFCPLLLALVIYWVKKLPPRLREAGMISDAPEKFGPWFKN